MIQQKIRGRDRLQHLQLFSHGNHHRIWTPKLDGNGTKCHSDSLNNPCCEDRITFSLLYISQEAAPSLHVCAHLNSSWCLMHQAQKGRWRRKFTRLKRLQKKLCSSNLNVSLHRHYTELERRMVSKINFETICMIVHDGCRGRSQISYQKCSRHI
jgi:hypothetical protein